MVGADVAEVAAIEAAVSPDPWSDQLFAEELDGGPRPDRIWLVAVDPEPAAGPAAMLDSGRRVAAADPDPGSTARRPAVVGYGGVLVVADEVHLLNLVVVPGWRRRGVASRLLAELLSRALDVGAVAATLEVRPSNGPAITLYERFGFTVVGRRPRYYPNGEDALVLWVHGLHHPERHRLLMTYRAASGGVDPAVGR